MVNDPDLSEYLKEKERNKSSNLLKKKKTREILKKEKETYLLRCDFYFVNFLSHKFNFAGRKKHYNSYKNVM